MAFPDKPIAQLLGSNGPIHTVAYSASPGSYILTGSADRAIRLYNPASTSSAQQPGSSFITKRQDATSAASPHAAAQAVGSIPAARLIQTFSAHGYEVLSLAVSADNSRFVSAGGDRAAFLWDVATGTTLRRFAGAGGGGAAGGGHSGRINSVTFAGAEDSLVVTGGFDTTVRIWDTRSGGTRPIMVLDEARDSVSAVAVRDAEVVAGSVDGRVRSYDVRAGRLVTDVVGAPVTSLCLARDGRSCLVASLDSRLRLMDRESGACLRTYSDAAWRNEDLRVQAVLGGGERFVVAGDELSATTTAQSGQQQDVSEGGVVDGRVWAWDVLSGKVVAKLHVPWGPSGSESRKRVVGRDGKEKLRKNIISCIAWKDGGFGEQFCVGGTSGVVTVYGTG